MTMHKFKSTIFWAEASGNDKSSLVGQWGEFSSSFSLNCNSACSMLEPKASWSNSTTNRKHNTDRGFNFIAFDPSTASYLFGLTLDLSIECAPVRERDRETGEKKGPGHFLFCLSWIWTFSWGGLILVMLDVECGPVRNNIRILKFLLF